jgi:hypothetical protein
MTAQCGYKRIIEAAKQLGQSIPDSFYMNPTIEDLPCLLPSIFEATGVFQGLSKN